MEIEELKDTVEKTTLADDGVFKVTIGPVSTDTNSTTACVRKPANNLFQPSKRMNCGLAVKRANLYLYGGMFEDGDKQITYNDLYSVDMKKLDEWKTIINDDSASGEWLGSDSSSEDSESSESEEDDSPMETE